MRGTAVIQTVTALSDFLNGSFLVARLARIDPLLPATIFQRTTGLPCNLTVAHAAEKVRVGDSSHSRVATTEREVIPAERVHPTAAY